MNWRLIVMLGVAFGLLMALVAILGWMSSTAVEMALWAVVGLVCSALIGRARGWVFVNGLLAGLLMGLVTFGLILALWGMFSSNNAEFMAQMAEDGQGTDPLQATVQAMLPVSIGWGAVLGVLSWLMSRYVWHRRIKA
jgi:hypothetical protein